MRQPDKQGIIDAIEAIRALFNTKCDNAKASIDSKISKWTADIARNQTILDGINRSLALDPNDAQLLGYKKRTEAIIQVYKDGISTMQAKKIALGVFRFTVNFAIDSLEREITTERGTITMSDGTQVPVTYYKSDEYYNSWS